MLDLVPDVNAGRRSYHSPVRAEAAQRTRRVIVAAASELFVERGYTAASLREVAEVAGVARPTVAAAFGSKPALLRQVLDEALAGDDEPVPVAQRPWFAPVWQAGDPRAVLTAYAGVCTVIGRRAARIFEVVHRAAGEGAEIAELWATLTRNRRAGAEMVVRRAVEMGPLRAGLTVEHAVDAPVDPQRSRALRSPRAGAGLAGGRAPAMARRADVRGAARRAGRQCTPSICRLIHGAMANITSPMTITTAPLTPK